jgi:hypothetical protein
MANSRFLMSTDVANLTPLTSNGQPVVSLFPKLSDHFSGSQLSNLLAEPALDEYSEERGYNGARWHSPLEGNPTAYTKLRETAKEVVREKLNELFSALSTMLPSHPERELLIKALCIPSQADIQIMMGSIVLINWGFVPAHAATDESALRNHFQTVYGEFCDIDQIWPLESQPTDAAAVHPV